MDQRGLNQFGVWALQNMGNILFNGPNGQGFPYTVVDPSMWRNEGHQSQSPGYRAQSQVSGSGFGIRLITPDEIRARLDLVNSKVQSLDTDIRTNVTRAAFVSSWETFRQSWNTFNEKNHSTANLIIQGTHQVNSQIDAFEVDLKGWQDAMVREAPQGRFITKPITSSDQSGQLPPGGILPGSKSSSTGLPWWAIGGLTVGGLALIGYLGYKAYTKFSPSHVLYRHAMAKHARDVDLFSRGPYGAYRDTYGEPVSEQDEDWT